MDIKLFVTMHKPFTLPEPGYYIPLQVGAQGKPPITFEECGVVGNKAFMMRDNEGENISEKNPYYCELTGLYYIWKNIKADAVGLVHYRRYFTKKSFAYRTRHHFFDSILQEDEAQALLKRADIVMPRKRNYIIETLYTHYRHTTGENHLDIAHDIVKERCPEYLPYVDRTYKSTAGSMFNMCIMKKPLFDEYCAWLFDILFAMEGRVSTEGMTAFDARFYGRVSEVLINAWVLKKKEEGVSVIEVPFMYTEHINWPKKVVWFLQAKFFGKKYTESI